MFHRLPISVRHLHRLLRRKVCSGGIILQALIQLFLPSERHWKGQVQILDIAQSIKTENGGVITSRKMVRLIIKTWYSEGVKLRAVTG